MDSTHNFRSIHVIIFVNSLYLILLIDLERGSKNFTTTNKLELGFGERERKEWKQGV
jgi:hypothetical protein